MGVSDAAIAGAIMYLILCLAVLMSFLFLAIAAWGACCST